MFQSKELNLPNGFKAIIVKKDTPIFSINLGVGIGSIFESEKEKGISHFIEHMLFKGTENRTNKKLNEDLEELAGEYNAYTDYNCTVYSITALNDEFENAMEIISDMVIKSNFPKDEVEKERKVILSELNGSKDDIEDFSFVKIKQLAYRNSPLKYDTIGTRENIENFTKNQLKNFYSKYYVPNNSYISVVSSYDYDYVERVIYKYFNMWSKKEFVKKNVSFEENIPGKYIYNKRDIEQSCILYLYTCNNLNKKEEMVLKVLNHRLGESNNSLLFRKLREEKGLAYDVYTLLDSIDSFNSVYIYTAVSKNNIDEAINTIDECIENIKQGKIKFNANTIRLMKKTLKTAIAFILDDSTDLSNYIVHQIIDNRNIYEFIDDTKKLDEIKEEDIVNLSKKIFNNPTIHILKDN
ncbi:M16 family metallopeptidase [Clostridium cochlearium]|uniref:M16 family metallopeptidase n=1 Tax=Clostridium cochlearium TaxID=1494 RepID=UPI000B946A66|nr:pitrilysin family protein [Clostridium cochlearium]MBV1820227.1 insulinase family protein [Bacteroidales bacterium MSK.15.36]NSJ91748.1 insulinase family protein [Coprococcus sp. MSK.21.13]MCG4571673.1 insulinase family protein [Clostridium cochlearium]SNV87099.1 zinc protease [Clostridium cochlearium]STA93447.1 zinc protease [Clostridium cochlearium]